MGFPVFANRNLFNYLSVLGQSSEARRRVKQRGRLIKLGNM